MIHAPAMHPPAHRDQYARKGHPRRGQPGQPQQCNAHGAALDDNGWPADEVAIAEDVFGAEVDESQG